MERLHFLLAALILVAHVVSIQSGDVGGPAPDLADLCAAATCCTGTNCRVIQECAGPACPPESECLPCVPEGVDDVCNQNMYRFALLVGDGSTPSELTERKCDPTQAGDCPTGSSCIDDGEGRGTCCYDFDDSGDPLDTDQAICPIDKCGGCEPGYVCRGFGVFLSNRRRYRCVKEITCPEIPPSAPGGFCPNLPDRCTTDDDCRASAKCCSNRCGRKFCFRPFILGQ